MGVVEVGDEDVFEGDHAGGHLAVGLGGVEDIGDGCAVSGWDELGALVVVDGMERDGEVPGALERAELPDGARDAGGGDGAEVYHSIVGGTGKRLADNILSESSAIKTGLLILSKTYLV